MKSMKKGFTLIELMIVVAIIAILAAIAIPAYQDYLIRSQVSEGSVLSSGAETALAEYYSNTGAFPQTVPGNLSIGIATDVSISGKYVSQVDINPGWIVAMFSGKQANQAIQGDTLIFSAITSAGSMSWSCDSAAHANTVPAKYLPTSCRTGG
jgi:type IV pilus assembly protein PilA